MKKQILFTLLLSSIFTLLNSCQAIDLTILGWKYSRIEKTHRASTLLYSETYNIDNKEILVEKYGKKYCNHLRLIVTDFQDSTNTIYILRKERYSNVRKPIKEHEFIIFEYAVATAVTDTMNAANSNKNNDSPHFFRHIVFSGQIEFEPISDFEKQLFRQAISKCKCKKQLGVDYDKIIGWVY